MLDVIKKRRSHRDYSDKEIEEEKLTEILKAAQFAPTAKNLRLWEFIVVKDRETKDLLSQTKKHAYFANKAPVVIVIVSADDGLTKYWIEDGSLAAQNIYLEATNQGLGACFIQIYGSKRDNGEDCEQYVKKILKVPENIHVLCLMPIGYPKEKLPEHSDKEFKQEKIHYEKY